MGLTGKVNNPNEPAPGSPEINSSNLEVCHETQRESQTFTTRNEMKVFLQHLGNIILFKQSSSDFTNSVFMVPVLRWKQR